MKSAKLLPFWNAVSVALFTVLAGIFFLMTRAFIVSNKRFPPDRALKRSLRTLFTGTVTYVVLSCDEAEARNLLLYAGHCPGVIAAIHRVFRDADLSLENLGDAVKDPSRPRRRP